MGFIKKNAFLLLCALAGIVSLGLMLSGMAGMSKVQAEMAKAKRLHGELEGVVKKATQPKAIDAEKDRIKRVREDHAAVMAHFAERCARKQLVENLLPDPGKGPAAKNLRYDFRGAYQQGMKSLLVRLNATQPPTAVEIGDVADFLKKKALEESEFAKPEEPADRASAPVGGGADRSGVRGGAGLGDSGAREKSAMPERDGPQSTQAYWKAVAELAARDANMLASITKARDKYCYANLVAGGSFDLHPIFINTDDSAPGLREIWDAQLFYWLESDIVEVLASVNDRVAAQIVDRKAKADVRVAASMDDPWVGNLPIKDVLSIRISDYINEVDGAPPSRRAESADRPPEHPDAVYTHLISDPLFDVMNIRVRLAIDIRHLPVILDALSHDSYYTILEVSYQAVQPSLSFKGKVYGPQPVVLATIDLQTYMYYKSYVPLMPLPIREQLGIAEEDFEKLVAELADPEGEEGGDAEGAADGDES